MLGGLGLWLLTRDPIDETALATPTVSASPSTVPTPTPTPEPTTTSPSPAPTSAAPSPARPATVPDAATAFRRELVAGRDDGAISRKAVDELDARVSEIVAKDAEGKAKDVRKKASELIDKIDELRGEGRDHVTDRASPTGCSTAARRRSRPVTRTVGGVSGHPAE